MIAVRARNPAKPCPQRSGPCCAEDIEAEDIEPNAVPARVFGLRDHCGATHAVYRKPPAAHPVALRSRPGGSA
jgi:hypothetical protein